MISCDYCGRENRDDADRCHECGTEMVGKCPPRAVEQPESGCVQQAPKFIDLEELEGAFVLQEGFSRPDWQRIWAAIDGRVAPADVENACQEVASQWVGRLQAELGGEYETTSSPHYILLSELKPEPARELGMFAEHVREQVRRQLGKAAERETYGPGVILLFSEQDDYDQYLSYFHGEGLHPSSSGCLLGGGYLHLAVWRMADYSIRATVAHELAHSWLAHLPVPLWLDEGYATNVERFFPRPRKPLLDSELREEHLAFWTEERVQGFWAGTSFQIPGDSNRLSYSLAEILVKLIARDGPEFIDFIGRAHFDDGGQTAALDCLGTSLGEVVGSFLGEGDWRPYRHRIVECWRSAGHFRDERSGEEG